jgi:uncharacterized protein HemY
VITMIGGFIMLFPITLRLGKVLEQWLADRKLKQGESAEIRALREVVQGLQAEVRRLAERQDFVEQVLNPAQQAAPALPAGGGADVDE